VRRGTAAAVASGAVALASLAAAPWRPARADGAAALVEQEFENAIKSVAPATVFCVRDPKIAIDPKGELGGSSGVIVSRDGYVLSDGDAGAYVVERAAAAGGRPQTEHVRPDTLEVRVPDLKRGTYAVYSARVVKRALSIDSTLLKIDKPPSALPFVAPSVSQSLEVGHFTFAVGTSGGSDAASALTAGVSLTSHVYLGFDTR